MYQRQCIIDARIEWGELCSAVGMGMDYINQFQVGTYQGESSLGCVHDLQKIWNLMECELANRQQGMLGLVMTSWMGTSLGCL
jgi:hypothetical protein